ncbi:MAG: potassium channel family protein, partial [Bacillota bacterium]
MRVIIIGSGKALTYVARILTARNLTPVVICPEGRQAEAVAQELGSDALVGGPEELSVMEQAGLEGADLVIALGEDDTQNMIACHLSKRLFGVQRCLALVHDPQNAEVLRALGADLTLSVAGMISEQLLTQIDRVGVTRQLPLADGHLVMLEITVPARAPVIGQSLKTLCDSGATIT